MLSFMVQKLGQLKGFKTPARSHTVSRSALPVFAEPPLPLSHRSCPRLLSPARPPPAPSTTPPLPRGEGSIAEPVLAEAAVSYLCSLIQADISLPRGPTFASRGTLASMYLSAHFPPASPVLRRLPLSRRLVCLPPLGCFFSGSPDLFPRRPSSSIDSQS